MGKEESYFIEEGDLLVEGVPFLELNALELYEQLNEHASLRLCGNIREEDEDSINMMAVFGKDIILKTRVGSTLFCGVLTELSVKHIGRLIAVEIRARSHTFMLDRKKKKRPFHDGDKTLEKLIRTVVRDTERAEVIIGAECQRTVGNFLMQYEETDWEFIKRVASIARQTLIPDVAIGYPAFYVGKSRQDCSQELSRLDSYSMLYDGENVYRVHSSGDWLKLGDVVRFRGLELYVRKVMVTLEQSVLCGTYELCCREGLDIEQTANGILAGKSVKGTVQDIQRDQVYVNVEDTDGNENGTCGWFPYSTVYASPDGSGWYCMPEVGDQVRIQFPDSEEKNAYAVSSISSYQSNRSQGDKMRDYTRRYIRNMQGMEIIWTPEYVRISANGSSVAQIDKNGLISITAGKKIAIRAGKDISVHAGRDIQLCGGSGVHIGCGVKAEINMDDNGVIEIKGNKIYTN